MNILSVQYPFSKHGGGIRIICSRAHKRFGLIMATFPMPKSLKIATKTLPDVETGNLFMYIRLGRLFIVIFMQAI